MKYKAKKKQITLHIWDIQLWFSTIHKNTACISSLNYVIKTCSTYVIYCTVYITICAIYVQYEYLRVPPLDNIFTTYSKKKKNIKTLDKVSNRSDH